MHATPDIRILKNRHLKTEIDPLSFTPDYAPMNQATPILNEIKKLTCREKECFTELSKGQSAKKIARVLGISPRTVEVHIENIKRKLACQTRLEVISKLSNFAAVI